MKKQIRFNNVYRITGTEIEFLAKIYAYYQGQGREIISAATTGELGRYEVSSYEASAGVNATYRTEVVEACFSRVVVIPSEVAA